MFSFVEPGTPYQVTVVAFTNAGRGALNDYIVFFSAELMPEMFPTNINYTRLNSASINVTWTQLSLFEAQGFPLYQAVLTEDSRNSVVTSDIVTTNSSFALFTNLSSDQQYTLMVGVATGNDSSTFVYSDPLTGMYVYVANCYKHTLLAILHAKVYGVISLLELNCEQFRYSLVFKY